MLSPWAKVMSGFRLDLAHEGLCRRWVEGKRGESPAPSCLLAVVCLTQELRLLLDSAPRTAFSVSGSQGSGFSSRPGISHPPQPGRSAPLRGIVISPQLFTNLFSNDANLRCHFLTALSGP